MKKGQKMSKESRIKMSNSHKRKIPHNKGKIFLSTKICGYCKKEFVIRGKKPSVIKKYCSRTCSGRSRMGHKSSLKGIPRTEEVKKKIGDKNRGRHLSIFTRQKMSERNNVKHLSPNTEFKKGMIAPMKGKKHTNEAKKKNSLAHIGKQKGGKHYNWKGEITPENIKIRNSIEYKLFVNSVFARDGYICQKIGTKGGKLHAHHILNFSEYPELRFAIDNGVTLSDKAHKEFHKKYGIKNNTREQLEEFLRF